MREIFCRFQRVSGAKINWTKTKAIDVGFVENNPIHIPWVATHNTLKVLGITFANSIRLMVKLNWDAMVASFARRTWLHSLRSLTLHQKVILLNTFITSKIWYLASVLPPSGVHTAKITTTMRRFMWSNVSTSIPMQQLGRDRTQGGLKLHLPALKNTALLVNRHLRETESLPFYRTFIIPNVTPTNPADLPDLKIICQHYRQLPPHIVQNPSSDLIHQRFIEQTDTPKIEQLHPECDWQTIWRSLHDRRFSSAEKSKLYLIVNEKGPYRKLLHTIGRVDDDRCQHCNGATETMAHKYSQCPRVYCSYIT